MAHKINGNTKAAAAKGADDLEILHPERTVHVAGLDVEVREYGWVAGLRIQAAVAPVVAALADAAAAGLDLERVQGVLAGHEDELIALVSAATDLTPAQIEALDDAEGQLLMLTWWSVNAGFFMRRVATLLAARRAAAASVGLTSTQPSLPTATTSAASATTAGASC